MEHLRSDYVFIGKYMFTSRLPFSGFHFSIQVLVAFIYIFFDGGMFHSIAVCDCFMFTFFCFLALFQTWLVIVFSGRENF